MSKNVSIEEGDRARNFGPTAKIKTELQQGGYCYWVPEDERETGMVFASTNRKYTPDEIGKYGIDEIDINIVFTGVDPDGNPWIVTIDPDTELPIIIYPPDDEIDIDPETGLPIPPIPPIDEIPGIVIEIDPDTGDVIIEEIPDPDMGDLDPIPIATIDDGILDDMGFDPESDIDFSIDDLGDIDDPGSIGIVGDIDGVPSIVDLDLDDLEWSEQDCPKSIYVLSRPAGIVYTDGDTIDFTGLSIAALDKDGMDWPDPSVFTPIPASEISFPTPTANMSDAKGSSGKVNGNTPAFRAEPGYTVPGDAVIFGQLCYAVLGTNPASSDRIYVNKNINGEFSYKSESGLIVAVNYIGSIDGQWHGWNPVKVEGYSNIPAPLSDDPIAKQDIDSFDEEEAIVPVKVQWTSPCFETLETTFDITVYPTDHGGSHHSGKF